MTRTLSAEALPCGTCTTVVHVQLVVEPEQVVGEQELVSVGDLGQRQSLPELLGPRGTDGVRCDLAQGTRGAKPGLLATAPAVA